MLEIQAVRDFAALHDIEKAWSALHHLAQPGTPFEHPAWAATWARQFVRDGELECVAVRDRDRGGELIGFAPLYRRRCSVAGIGASWIQPLGTGRRQALTEVVQVLSLPNRTRDVLRAVVNHLEGLPDWNWIQLSLAPDQGWFVPQWLQDRAGSLIEHRAARPCVVVDPLPADLTELAGGLKRNVRESVRRANNRALKVGDISLRCETEADRVVDVLGGLIALHRKRSKMPGKVAHPDVLAGRPERRFFIEAVQHLAAHGLARAHVAEHGGRQIAGQLVLSDGATDYLSITGLDPEYWELSLNTLLVYQALVAAVQEGRRAVNLSTGPDVAKLRWSPRVVTYNDFMVVRGDPASRWLYGAYAHLGLAVQHHQERGLHRIRGWGG